MMIDDLNDEMLREILCRLPCYRTALQCKAVSKRWCSMISNPLFITQAFLMHREIKEEAPSLVFLLTMDTLDDTIINSVTAMVAPPCFETRLLSLFLFLKSLPDQSRIVATFKDLILGYSLYPWSDLEVYYICNPQTKQRMVLPPSQLHQQKPVIWAALTYHLDGRRFRVVAAHSRPKASSGKDYPFVMINLLIYISETCEWRNIDVRLQSKPCKYGYYDLKCYTGVVCKGMVCIHYGRHFVAFNPFDVTDTSHGTLTVIYLPSPAGEVVILLESNEKLVAFEDFDIRLRLNYEGNLGCLLGRKRIWKMDLRRNNNDKQLPQWELLSQFDGHINIKGTVLSSRDPLTCGYYTFIVLGLHPNKEHLVYLVQQGVRDTQQSWLFLLDTKSKTLERLTKTFPPYDESLTSTCPKLDIPCWPTPLPIP